MRKSSIVPFDSSLMGSEADTEKGPAGLAPDERTQMRFLHSGGNGKGGSETQEKIWHRVLVVLALMRGIDEVRNLKQEK